MKKTTFILILLLSLNSQAQVIRIPTVPIFDYILNIIPIDSTEYVINVGAANSTTLENNILYRVSNNSTILQQLDFSTLFNGQKTVVPTFLPLTDTSYVALASVYYDEAHAVSNKFIFLGSHFEVEEIVSFGDSTATFLPNDMLIDHAGNLVISGKQYSALNTSADDSARIMKFTNKGNLISQNACILDTMIIQTGAGNVCDIIELPYYGMYVVAFRNSPNRLYTSNDLQSLEFKFNTSGNSFPRNDTYQISDKKFVTGVNILDIIPENPESTTSNVGFLIADTASIQHYGSTFPNEVHEFGLPEHNDNFIGMDFVYPDTILLTYIFFDTSISPKAITTLVKATLSGETIWSKDFQSDKLEQVLFPKAVGDNILLYGYYYDSLYTSSSNPLIIKLNSEGGIQSTSDIEFTPLDIQIYPNPTSSMLNIKIDQGINKFEHLKIINIMGQCVYESAISNRLQSTNVKIDVSKFTKGTYVLLLSGNGNQSTKKLIIN